MEGCQSPDTSLEKDERSNKMKRCFSGDGGFLFFFRCIYRMKIVEKTDQNKTMAVQVSTLKP